MVNGKTKKRVLHLSGQPIQEITLTFGEKIGKKLGNPQIMLLLLVIGILGIYLEVKTPGAFLPGLIGAIALIGFLFATQILPINYLGIILIFMAMIFFIAEIYVTSYGALSIAALVSLAIGLKILFQTKKSIGLQIPPVTIIGIIAVIGAFVVILGALLAKDFRRKKHLGREGLIGETGIAKTRIEKSGKVFIHGELWDARTIEESIQEGSLVEVSKVEGLKLVVRKKTNS